LLAFSRWLGRFRRLSRFSGLHGGLTFSSRFSRLSRLGGFGRFSRLRRFGRFLRFSGSSFGFRFRSWLGFRGRLRFWLRFRFGGRLGLRLRRWFGLRRRFRFGSRFRSWLGFGFRLRLRRGFWLGGRLWRGFWFWFGGRFWLRLRCRLGFFGRGLLGLPFLLAPLPKQALFLGFFCLGKDHTVRGQRILRPRLESGLRAVVERHGAQRRGCHEQAECGSCQNPWLAFHRQILL
jgi:hypothetical protein